MSVGWSCLPLLPLSCILKHLSLEDALSAMSTSRHWRSALLMYEGQRKTLKLNAKQFDKCVFLAQLFKKHTNTLQVNVADCSPAELTQFMRKVMPQNRSISPVNQLLATLRFYATNNTQMSIGDFGGISTPTSHRIIHQVSAAIASLHKEYIRFPTTREEIRKEQDSFFQIARFPRVIGAMDCTHVRISSPGGDHAELYRNRKGYFSINVQTICNANLEITDIVARWPGSSHDSTIFNNSCIKAKFESGQYGNALLLVDGGYASTSYMMTPLQNPRTPVEQLYNESQIRTRNPVERSYGVWKKRFPALALGLRTKLDKSLTIIVATAVLHNMLRQQGEANPIDDPELQLPAPWDELLNYGQIDQQPLRPQQYIRPNAVRDAIINDYFQSIL